MGAYKENEAIEFIKKEIKNLEEAKIEFSNEIEDKSWLRKNINEIDKDIFYKNTILNLIEKLKKENHDLNNKVWLYTDKYNDMVISNGKYLDKIIKLEKYSIPKDKIREKIIEKEAEKEGVKNISLEEYAITSKELKESEICLLKSLLEEE